jgi:hypothetical protein
MMSPGIQAIEAALATVQTTLDKLTARGCNEAAFDLARAQYAASIRSSWPANLGSVASALAKLADDAAVDLTADERAALRGAAETFQGVRHP